MDLKQLASSPFSEKIGIEVIEATEERAITAITLTSRTHQRHRHLPWRRNFHAGRTEPLVSLRIWDRENSWESKSMCGICVLQR